MQLFMPKKKPRIPPLTQKDIIVAEIDCRDSVDRTEEYREMIAKKHHPLDISSDEDALTRSRTETEKLKLLRVDNLGVPFELQKETSEENRLISEFTSLNVNFEPDTNLDELIQKMQKRVGFYSDKEAKTGDALEKLYKHFHSSTVEGRVSVDKASSNSEVLYEKIIETRKSYKELRGKLVDNSLKITQLMAKSKNIESVLEIVEIWKGTLLGKLGSFNTDPNQQRNLIEMVKAVEEVKQSFKTDTKDYKEYGCFVKMEQFLNKKKESIIKEIESSYERRVMDFDESKYWKQVEAYNQLLKESVIVKRITLSILLDRNLASILKSSYQPSFNEDINSIQNQQYIQFITYLTSEIERYCRNWHLATRWHMEYQNQSDKEQQAVVNEQGKEYLRFRKMIFQKIEQRIADIVSKTYVFYRFTLAQRGVFLLKLYKLLLEISLFARETPKLIGEVVKKKCKQERQIVEKGYLSWLKQLIIGEVRIPLFELQNEPRPFESGELQKFSEYERRVIQEFQNNKLSIDFEDSTTPINVEIQRKNVELNYPPLPDLPEFSSTLLICQFTREITKRIYFNPKIGKQMFNKLKEMLELQVISIYCACCPLETQKQLQQDWSKFSSIKISKYDDIEGNIPKIQYYKDCQKLQSQYYQLHVQIPYLLNKFPLNIPNTIISPSLQTKGQILQNLLTTHAWLSTNIHSIFPKEMEKEDIESIVQELRLLQLLIKQVGSIIYTTIIEDTKYKYQGLASSVKDLKWEIKKYNNETSQIFKAYKNNYFSVFESQILSLKLNQMKPQLKRAVQTSLVNDIFKALTDAYSKIEKINGNGRQLMRLDALQIEERIKGLGISTENTFMKHLIKFIQLGFQSEASKLEVGIKSQLPIFPFKIWKPLLVSAKASDEISWVERRDVLLRLGQQYLTLVATGQPK